MNMAVRASLFNALLFPGWGQIYLKRYKKGAAIILAVLAGILSILWSVVQITTDYLKASPFRKSMISYETVIWMTINSLKELKTYHVSYLLLFLLCLWLFSIIDAYRTGKKLQSIIQNHATGANTSDQQSTTSPDSNQR